MTPQLIVYILMGLVIGILFFGMFWGMIRGFKKSLFRGLWLLGMALLMFFLTPIICKALFKLDLSFLNITIQGEKLITINALIDNLIMSNPQVEEILINNPSLEPLVKEIVVLILNSFMFPILFWIVKILTYPITAILSLIIFRNKKEIINGKRKIYKSKKHRLAGMATGLVAGFAVAVVTLVPINGTLKMVREVDQVEYNGGTNGEGIVTSLLGKDVMKYVDTYLDGPFNKALTYTGVNFIDESIYNALSRKTINNETISLKEEIKLYVSLYNDIEVISKTNFNNIQKTELDKFLNSSESLVNSLFTSKIVKITGNELIDYAFKKIEENQSLQNAISGISIQEFKDLAEKGIQELKTSNVSSAKKDLLNVIYICRALNETDIMIPMMYNQLKPMDYLNKFTDEVVSTISNYLFQMPSVRKVYPIAINKSLTYIARMLNFTYDEIQFNNDNLTKTDFVNIINGGLGVVRTLNFNSPYYVTKMSFEATGSFLDAIKNLNILENGVYDNIITKLIDKGINYLQNQNLNIDLQTLITNVVVEFRNMILDKETVFKNEFKQYGVLFDDVKNTIETFKNTKKDELILNVYGKLIDKLNNTEIFKKVLPDLLNTGWDLVKTKIEQSMPDFKNINVVVDKIKNNIVGIVLKSPGVQSPNNIQLSIEYEFNGLQDLYDFICLNIVPYFKSTGTGAEGLMNDLFEETNKLFVNLGAEFDKLKEKNHLIINNDVVKSLVAEVFDIAKNKFITDETIVQFMNEVVYNIKNINSKNNWSSEFGFFKDLLSLKNTGSDINSIGPVLDKVCKSSFINHEIINNLLADQVQKQYDSQVSAELKADTKDIIDNIKVEISKINSPIYTKAISDLMSAIDIIKDFNTLTLDQIGQKLDSYNNSILNSSRKLMIKFAFNKKRADFSDETILLIMDEIGTNIDNIADNVADNFYQTELGHIQKIIDSINNIGTMTYNEIGTTLDSLNSSVLIANVRSKVIDVAITEKLKDTTLSKTVKNVLNKIKLNVESIPSEVSSTFYTEEFGALQSVIDLNYPKNKEELTTESLGVIGSTFYNLTDKTLSYNLGEIVMEVMFDYVNYADITNIINSIKTTIIGANGILPSNRIDSVNPNKEANYVKAFTDIGELVKIYGSISGININGDVDLSLFGGFLDQFNALSIIKNEDRDIAIKIINECKTNITGKSTIITNALNSIAENTSRIPDDVSGTFYTDEFSALKKVMDLKYPTDKTGLNILELQTIGKTFYDISDKKLSYNLGEVAMGIMFDFIEYSDIQNLLTTIKNRIVGENGILPLNRIDSTNIDKETNYVKAFTDIGELVKIYDSINNTTVDKNLQISTLGGSLDKLSELIIIDGEDKEIATRIINEFNTVMTTEVETLFNTKIAEVQDDISIDGVIKEQIIQELEALKTTKLAELNTVFETANNEISNKTEKTYLLIFEDLEIGVTSLIDDVKLELENINKMQ